MDLQEAFATSWEDHLHARELHLAGWMANPCSPDTYEAEADQ